ncbi:MAG: hypothetical protein HXS50_05875, partial [Theionarchaea archaeon]|nr:hypothetical protein [Theionarchaea archaeon]
MGPTCVGLHYLDGTRDIVLEEILRAEGIPYDRFPDMRELEGCYSAILGEVELSQSELGLIQGYVEEGGVLLAVRPGNSLCEKFGLALIPETQSDGYLVVDAAAHSGRLQVLGISKRYTGGRNIYTLEPSGNGG